MKKILVLLLASLMGLTVFSQSMTVTNKDLGKLASMMSGEFSSEQQAFGDKDFIHIQLRMTPVMKDNTDGHWLYVEQAVASSPEAPYRQRVYHLYIQNDTTIISKVYELKNPDQYIGGYKDKSKLNVITSDSLIDRQGCNLALHKTGKKQFRGSTPGKECLSTMKGATYATSEVTITPKKMVTWDRGWNREDKQVWGSEKGGYVFLKK